MTQEKPLRIVFFGTPEFAVESLRAIYDANFDIPAVVTMPDKPAGRGNKMFSSPVKVWALDHDIKVLQPVSLKDPEFIDELHNINADIFVVIAFRMLPEAVWSMPPLGTFNLHASLLPQYRGAAPINWAIINGEEKTGVTTFFLKHEIDTGDIIDQEAIDITPEDNAGSVHDKLMHLGAELTVKTLKKIQSDDIKLTPQPQSEGGLKPAPKIFHTTCFINWDSTAQDIVNFVRGLSPYPAARALMQFPRNPEAEYKIFEILKTDRKSTEAPGTINVENKQIFIATGDFDIKILSLQAQGKKRMDVADFLNGLRM